MTRGARATATMPIWGAGAGRWRRGFSMAQAAENLDWLDVGCGTGALSGVVLSRCNPRSLVGIEQSAGFVATAQRNIADKRARFEVGDAQNLPLDDHSRDIVASALVLNFVPDIPKALSEMKRVARPGGTVAFYCLGLSRSAAWDSMRAFWNAAIALDPAVASRLCRRQTVFLLHRRRPYRTGPRMPACSQWNARR